MQKVTIKFNNDNFSPIVEAMESKAAMDESFQKPFQDIIKFFNLLFKITTVNMDNNAAPTFVVLVNLEPTDGFRSYSAAFLASDFNSFSIEHDKFLSSLTEAKSLS